MAAVLDFSTGGTANATTLVLTIPSGATVGAHMTILWYSQTTYTLTNPAGWTQYDDDTTNIGNLHYRALTKVIASGEPGTTVTLTTATANKMSAVMWGVTGFDTTTPFAHYSKTAANTTSSTRQIPSTTLANAALTFAAVGTRAATTTLTDITTPSPWTERQQFLQATSGDACAALASQSASAGAVGGENFTTSATTARGVTTLIAYNDAAAANNAPTANAGADQTVDGGVLVTLDGSGSSDPDAGDTLTYAWTPPGGITLSSNTAQSPTFTAPLSMTQQNYTFSLVVTDNHAEPSTSDSVQITVRAHGEWYLSSGGTWIGQIINWL